MAKYPGLVSLLALNFKIFSVSYNSALWMVAMIFLGYLAILYVVIRKAFDIYTAIVTMLITVFSLLQLNWNMAVYSEGLFGFLLALLVLWTISISDRTLRWWIGAGVILAMLYLTRPNGILLMGGFFCVYLLGYKEKRYSIGKPVAAITVMFIVLSPWLIRSYIYFDHPFHIGASAGLLRATNQEIATRSMVEFLKEHGILFPFMRITSGIMGFWKTLHFYEKGLQILPLLFAVIGIFRRKIFYNAFISCGFLITLIACFYVSYSSYAGVRYFSSFMPFIYAYGIHELFQILKKVSGKRWTVFRFPAVALVCIVLLSPVVNPHRFYFRKYSGSQPHILDVRKHISILNTLVERNQGYFAGQLCQLNFLTEFNCVGIQESFDSSSVKRSMEVLGPRFLVVTLSEMKSIKFQSIFSTLEELGYKVEEVKRSPFAQYFSINKQTEINIEDQLKESFE